MSRHQVAGGLTVRGTCAAGHVTEATTDPGRVTWEGPCARAGCELKVKARTRVGAAPPPPAVTPPKDPPANDEPEPPATTAPKPKPKVKQVNYDAQPPKRAQSRRRSAGESTDPPQEPAAEPASATTPVHRGAEPPAGDQPGPTAVTGARRARIRERITGRREAGPPPKAAREFRLPF